MSAENPEGGYAGELRRYANTPMTPPIPPGERLSEAEREALTALVAAMPSAHILRELSRDDGVLTRKYPVTMMDGTMLTLHALAARLLATPSDSGGEGLRQSREIVEASSLALRRQEVEDALDEVLNEHDDRLSVGAYDALVDRLAATPPTAATPIREITGSVSLVMEDARATTPTMQAAATPSAGDALDFLESTEFRLLLDPDGEEYVPLHDLIGTAPPARVTLLAGTREHPIALTRPQGAATLAVDDAAIETACRGFYGLRWTAMSEQERKSPRRWMQDALAALNPSQAGGGNG